MRAAHDEWLAGRLPPASATFVDEIVARYWRKLGSASPFLDDERRVHRGLLHLVLDDAAAARQHLGASLAGGFSHRADLWGYMGDAALTLERAPEANACYVRALLLSAADLDLQRIRLRPLAALYEELRRQEPEPSARELLLVNAWLQHVLDIEPGNGWFDGQLSRLEASCADRRDRRFAWLLYLDRSQPDGRVDLARREEMAELDPNLFARFMLACREREHSAG